MQRCCGLNILLFFVFAWCFVGVVHAETTDARQPTVRRSAPSQAKAPKKKQPSTTRPLAVSFADAPSQFPALVIKGFMTLGLWYESAVPRLTFLMEETELEFDVHFSKHVRLELAFQLLKDTFDVTTVPTSITLLDQVLQKASLFFQLPKGFGLLVGRYLSYQGYEALNTLDRLQVTGSYTFDMTSSTLTALAVRWEGGNQTIKTQIDLFASNRWDRNDNAILQPSIGVFVSVALKASSAFSLKLTATPSYGVEPAIVSASLSTTPVFSFSTNAELKFFGERWMLVADLAIADEPSSGQWWYAVMALTHVKATEYLAFTLRFSEFNDVSGLLGGAGPATPRQEFSVAIALSPMKIATDVPSWASSMQGLRILLEGRIDLDGLDTSTMAGRVLLSVIMPFQLILQPAK